MNRCLQIPEVESVFEQDSFNLFGVLSFEFQFNFRKIFFKNKCFKCELVNNLYTVKCLMFEYIYIIEPFIIMNLILCTDMDVRRYFRVHPMFTSGSYFQSKPPLYIPRYLYTCFFPSFILSDMTCNKI